MKDILDIPRTAMEVFEMLPEGTICEVIDNTLYMSPSPTTTHQELLLNIASEIRYLARKNAWGRVFVSPCDVYLNDGQNVVQPDILFVSKGRDHIIQNKGVFGAPDLVIEILSTNKFYDQEKKLELYRANSVPEYVIIDPETKQVWHYLFENDTYLEQASENGKLIIRQLGLELSF